ncbi:2'-5' RNA ligase family protein [Tepidibacillus infernus]|uniref:Putative phosphoesterase U473_07230 n=1 Tax=Tepidibacillus decaturensis TaxID=1413211 RepID=A0A135L4N5_9BACI|nr:MULTISPECIES: 2'-5' RNA ligase family protein [Tepidibacillus]KXG43823.1 hypothetical protein U473_07230 [Tepidibacillus decaturensis]GBF11112.1 2',5' RNA ligase family [Tepidibacillus sp. HK-1]
MKYGIVIYPQKEIQDWANSLRKRYDSHYTLIPPHITIKEAFEIENINEAIQYIENITSQIPPFTLKLSKVGTFLPISPVVYVGFEKNPVIYELQEKLNADILKRPLKHQFIPHMTIAQDLHEQEIHDVYGRLKLENLNKSILVDRIHLCYQIENQSWTVYQTFLLTGK